MSLFLLFPRVAGGDGTEDHESAQHQDGGGGQGDGEEQKRVVRITQEGLQQIIAAVEAGVAQNGGDDGIVVFLHEPGQGDAQNGGVKERNKMAVDRTEQSGGDQHGEGGAHTPAKAGEGQAAEDQLLQEADAKHRQNIQRCLYGRCIARGD